MKPVVVIQLTPELKAIARSMAKAAEIGGVSRVRGSDRQAMLGEDQLIGQYGQLALSMYLYGHAQPYVLSRHVQNRNPRQGDGGSDLLGTNVDVKTSLMRAGREPARYNLIVRPAERHPHTVYILALIEQDLEAALLVGWATEPELPKTVAASGVFQGAHVLPATSLNPLPPIRYNFE